MANHNMVDFQPKPDMEGKANLHKPHIMAWENEQINGVNFHETFVSTFQWES